MKPTTVTVTDVLPRLATATPEQLNRIASVLNNDPETTESNDDLRGLRNWEIEKITGLNRWEIDAFKKSGVFKTVRTPSGRTRATRASVLAWYNGGGKTAKATK